MNNGNGKIDPAVITAQQATEAALKPLREAERRVATTRHRLAEAEQVLALAEADYEDAQTRWVEDDTPAHKQQLRQTHDDQQAARTRVEGFKRKLATEEAAIGPLRIAHDTAMIILAEAQRDANLAHLEDEWSAARNARVEHEAKGIQLLQAEGEAERRYKALAAQKRESEQRQSARDAVRRFRQVNGPEPGIARVRIGF